MQHYDVTTYQTNLALHFQQFISKFSVLISLFSFVLMKSVKGQKALEIFVIVVTLAVFSKLLVARTVWFVTNQKKSTLSKIY